MNINTRTSLLLFLTGVVLLHVYEIQYSPETMDVRELTYEHVGRNVLIHGTIEDVNVREHISFLTLKNRTRLDIVSFTPLTEIEPGDRILLEGTVDTYHGNLQVIVDELDTAPLQTP